MENSLTGARCVTNVRSFTSFAHVDLMIVITLGSDCGHTTARVTLFFGQYRG
jgi:hypothetical protein